MSPILRVENLHQMTTTEDVVRLFSGFGEVRAVELLPDSQQGNGVQLGFVEMTSDIQARRAIVGLHDEDYQGCVLGVRPTDRQTLKRKQQIPTAYVDGSFDMQ